MNLLYLALLVAFLWWGIKKPSARTLRKRAAKREKMNYYQRLDEDGGYQRVDRYISDSTPRDGWTI